MRLQQIVEPGGTGAFFEGHQQAALQPGKELQNGGRPGLQDGFHHQLAGRVLNRDGNRCLVNIQTDILFAVHEGAPFVGCGAMRSQPTPKGRPFIMRSRQSCAPNQSPSAKWTIPREVEHKAVNVEERNIYQRTTTETQTRPLPAPCTAPTGRERPTMSC